ncbi:ABC transporter ATP-binding protein [Rhodococcoides kyotonense]|uniref:Iron complex transport system ATP-binding protein n=1 Tax=Rhodococcoides kyotonense TaxID=398843 RepID=A0A239NG49_9NOCA|nr:ATP-binding cassette domain-containing protein [Rhodococcus kyotonensis]SNT53278.1 iron complex transport system ATP-binding protein [Rhodococcus kyotonensis]
MNSATTEAVRVSDVAVVRNGRSLLNSISLSILHGEHWAILGPNGAGKSTLLSLLGALVHPTRGSVHVLGRRLGRVDMRELRTFIGHVGPRHRLEQPSTALEVVMTGLTNTAVRVARHEPSADHIARAHMLLEQLGMSDRLHTVWTTMSQGERGRVLIARALISQPQLLLLDEPSTGLDVAAREQLLDALGRLADEDNRLSTVLVTHHLEELPPHTSHALLLNGGRMISAGPVETALTSENVSRCFGHGLEIGRAGSRWFARTSRPAELVT